MIHFFDNDLYLYRLWMFINVLWLYLLKLMVVSVVISCLSMTAVLSWLSLGKAINDGNGFQW